MLSQIALQNRLRDIHAIFGERGGGIFQLAVAAGREELFPRSLEGVSRPFIGGNLSVPCELHIHDHGDPDIRFKEGSCLEAMPVLPAAAAIPSVVPPIGRAGPAAEPSRDPADAKPEDSNRDDRKKRPASRGRGGAEPRGGGTTEN